MSSSLRVLDFSQAVEHWYSLELNGRDPRWSPLQRLYEEKNNCPWTPAQWMFLLQELPVNVETLQAIRDLCWLIADVSDAPLPWLHLWEKLHHVSVAYYKFSAADEYMTSYGNNFVPQHSEQEITRWTNWLRQNAQDNLCEMWPFLAYTPWLEAIAHNEEICCEIDKLLSCNLNEAIPEKDYARVRWACWSMQHRESVDFQTWYLLLDDVALSQLHLFWTGSQQEQLQSRDFSTQWRNILFASKYEPKLDCLSWLEPNDDWSQHIALWAALIRWKEHGREHPLAQYCARINPLAFSWFEQTVDLALRACGPLPRANALTAQSEFRSLEWKTASFMHGTWNEPIEKAHEVPQVFFIN